MYSDILIIISLTASIYAFPTGAPLKHCGDMMPGHDVEPMDDVAPFHITVQPGESNLKIKLTADDQTHFKGFLIEARSSLESNEAIGVWTTSDRHTKLLDCFNKTSSAVTHYFRDDKYDNVQDGPKFTELNFVWTHSNIKNLKKVYFVATVVKKFKQIYMNITTGDVINPSQLVKQENLFTKLRKFFLFNFSLEYVHLSFIVLVFGILVFCFILLHLISLRRRKDNNYVMLKNEKLFEES